MANTKTKPSRSQQQVGMRGVEVIQQYRVIRKCGHREFHATTTAKRTLKQLTASVCYDCQSDTCLLH